LHGPVVQKPGSQQVAITLQQTVSQHCWLPLQQRAPLSQQLPLQEPQLRLLPQALKGAAPQIRPVQSGWAQQLTAPESQPQVHPSTVVKSLPCALHMSRLSPRHCVEFFKHRPQ
jgi:hypothetical protein